MARLTAEQFDNYSSGASSEWFKLTDDGDSAKVQFFGKGPQDLDVFTVHKVKLNDKERLVNCLRNYDDPIDVCPFCAAGMKPTSTMVVSMYNHTSGGINIWTRGRKFKQQLDTLYNEYGADTENMVFKIIRSGKKGSTDTSYQVLPQRDPPIDMSTLEKPDVIGSVILDKTADEMDYYLATNEFPRAENEATAPQVTRRGEDISNPPTTRSRRGF